MREVVPFHRHGGLSSSEWIVYACDCGNIQFLVLEDGAVLCPVCQTALKNLRISVTPPEPSPAA